MLSAKLLLLEVNKIIKLTHGFKCCCLVHIVHSWIFNLKINLSDWRTILHTSGSFFWSILHTNKLIYCLVLCKECRKAAYHQFTVYWRMSLNYKLAAVNLSVLLTKNAMWKQFYSRLKILISYFVYNVKFQLGYVLSYFRLLMLMELMFNRCLFIKN